TASSSAVIFWMVSLLIVPSSSMLYLGLCWIFVSSLYHADSVTGMGTSHWKVADSFSLTSRSVSFDLKGILGS
ncbi:hypothetical protein FKM82_026969, partial [Ascaphus truei]